MDIDLIKVLVPALLAFLSGIAITPFITRFLYKHRLWRRASRTDQEEMSPAFHKLHNGDTEQSTPRMGGIVIWASVLIVIFLMWLISVLVPGSVADKMDFLSRNQTLLPLGALIFAALLGLVDDLFQIFDWRLRRSAVRDSVAEKFLRIGIVLGATLVGAWWFYVKLEMSAIHIPFWGQLELGFLFVPFFVAVVLGIFSSSVIDGMDGLAAGVLMPVFTAYSIIAFAQNQIDLSALSAVIAGGLMAFLWFNIPPARFYLGETGIIGLTVVLGVIVFLTDTTLELLIIGAPLVATSLSASIQIYSKRYLGKKIFLIAPLHFHFEALGWPREKVVMRYWVFSWMCAMLGVIIALAG